MGIGAVESILLARQRAMVFDQKCLQACHAIMGPIICSSEKWIHTLLLIGGGALSKIGARSERKLQLRSLKTVTDV